MVGSGDPRGVHGTEHQALLPARGEQARILPDALRRAATSDRGIVMVGRRGERKLWSYARLLQEAERCAHGLRALGARGGSGVICHLRSLPDFLSVFWGAQLCGSIAVPLIPLDADADGGASRPQKLLDAIDMFDEPPVVTSNGRVTAPQRSGEPALVVTVGELRRNDLGETRCAPQPAIASDDAAVVLLTSGTTGSAKGVEARHDQLFAWATSVSSALDLSADDVSLNWMPLDHMGGLAFHLRDVVMQSNQVQVEPDWILTSPFRWVDLLSEFKVTVSWAPNFAFGLDYAAPEDARSPSLAHVRCIINGSELIDHTIVSSFLTRSREMGLRRAAVRAAWGMSETASCVTLGEIPEDGWSGVFVPVGRPIPGIELRIVDDAGQPVDDSVQGHLQIRGRAVSTTYRGRPDLSGAAVTPDGWFVTGDLGFISDGVLTITGREKDLVIVNGVNYSCREIEAALDRSAALNPLTTTVIALRRPASATDEVVAFVEPRGGWLDVDAVRRRTFEASGVRIDQFVHVDAGQIPRTSTAKRQRSVLADRFLAGEYDDRVIVSSKEQVSKRPSTTSELCRIAGDVLGIADVGPDDDFFGAGGDSVAAVRFVVAANDAGYELDLTSLFRHSVLRELEQTASSKRATAV